MKTIRQIIAILLVAGCLASCGGCGSNDIEETTPTETELTETERTIEEPEYIPTGYLAEDVEDPAIVATRGLVDKALDSRPPYECRIAQMYALGESRACARTLAPEFGKSEDTIRNYRKKFDKFASGYLAE